MLKFGYFKLGVIMNSKIKQLTGNCITFLAGLIPIFKSCPPCPICMPKYAAIFAFFGLEMSDYSHYLVPVMLLGIGMTLMSVYNQCKSRKISKYPFYSAVLFSSSLLIGKFVYDNNWVIYSSMAGLFASLLLHYHSMGKSACEGSSCSHSHTQ